MKKFVWVALLAVGLLFGTYLETIAQDQLPESSLQPPRYPAFVGPADRTGAENAERAIYEALERRTSLDAFDLPLSEFTDGIAKHFRIQAVMDEAGLDLVGVTPEDTITLKVKGVTLRSALKLALAPKDLTYTIRNESLVITSIEAAFEDLVTKTHDVSSLVFTGNSPKSGTVRHGKSRAKYDVLSQALQETIAPEAWDEAGGTCSIAPLVLSEKKCVLVISATIEIHFEIYQLLNKLREQSGREVGSGSEHSGSDHSDEDETSESRKVPDDAIMIYIYPLKADSMKAAEGVELIKTTLEDVNWDETGIYIKPIGKTLVIKQTKAIHDRIYSILDDLNALEPSYKSAAMEANRHFGGGFGGGGMGGGGFGGASGFF